MIFANVFPLAALCYFVILSHKGMIKNNTNIMIVIYLVSDDTSIGCGFW